MTDSPIHSLPETSEVRIVYEEAERLRALNAEEVEREGATCRDASPLGR